MSKGKLLSETYEIQINNFETDFFASQCAEDNLCVFEIYDTTYEKVCIAFEQIEKEIEEDFERIHPKPYLLDIENETEDYKKEVVYHREIRSIDEVDGFCRFYVLNEQPEIIHGLLSCLNRTFGKAELIVRDKAKRPYTKKSYGVRVFLSDGEIYEYEKQKHLIIKENKSKIS